MAFPLDAALRQEYQNLFNSCVVNPAHANEVNRAVSRIAANRPRYEATGGPIEIPWFFIGLIHNMESSLSFDGHLHNGDPLTARTVHEPKGRPPGNPPFTWEQSAMDALEQRHLAHLPDWSLPAVLHNLEGYNGFGYRKRGVPTPYLWSFSNQYRTGKFVQDGVFDPSAVSKQCGAAVILSQMVANGLVSFPAAAAAP